MDGYVNVALKELYQELGEERVKTILSSFSCPLNTDIEVFLKQKAIEFAKQGLSETHLVFTSYKDSLVLLGYYTIALKSFVVTKHGLNNKLRSKISKFGTYDNYAKGYTIAAPLLAQLGKNFTNSYNKLISGDLLLKIALDKISMLRRIAGSRFVYVECEESNKLINFYTSNGFCRFWSRPLDEDELNKGSQLIQLLKYCKDT